MSQDIVSDALNQIMNAKKVEKREIEIKQISKVLINLFEMMKEKGHLDFSIGGDEKKPVAVIKLLKINECRAIKPRYNVGVGDIDKYLRRFLPTRNFGTLVVSTSNGLMSHEDAYENKSSEQSNKTIDETTRRRKSKERIERELRAWGSEKMGCSKCGSTKNPPNARFCADCGAKL